MTDEEIVLAKREKIDKKAKGKMTEPVALLAKQLAEKSLMENAFDGKVECVWTQRMCPDENPYREIDHYEV